jgi:NADPH:quinone reductase-like Zn-dependent oxidoreductase
VTAAANAPTECPATNCGISPWSSVRARADATPAISRVTDRVFPFEQIPDAFAYLEEGHAKGKVIVRL